jgi:drug/metabolite transporter (DMT)-like permease
MGDFVEMVSTGLIFAAVGAVGDAGYLTVSKNWKQSRWPRWMLVGFWTSLVAPTLVAVIALARQYTGVTESFLLVMIVGTFPAFITAFLTSQLPTTTADPFTQ